MTRRGWIALGLVLALAAGVRVAALDSPQRRVWDETWYARDGCYYWLHAQTTCRLRTFVAPDRDVQGNLARYGEVTPEHPPLGKLLIGAPVRVLGFGPRPWRLAAVLAGVLTVALLFAFIRVALSSTTIAAGGALLLAVDYPHFIHSRLAMLDVFLCLFTLAAFFFVFLDRAQIEARHAGRASHHWWRLGAGVAAGAAAATKLSGGAVAVGVLALVVGWELAARRRAGASLGPPGRTAAWIALLLVVVPLAVHAATYVGRVDGTLLALPWQEDSWVRAWVDRMSLMLETHTGKASTLSSPFALPMTSPPMRYMLERRDDTVREILLFGNPLLWWAGFVAVVYAAVAWLRDRGSAVAAVIVVGFLAAYAGWLAATLTQTVAFLFYALPVAPFLYLALAHAYARLPASRTVRVFGAATVAISLAAFAFYWPILTARPLTVDAWRPRACSAQTLWLASQPDCGLSHARESRAPATPP